MKNGINAINTKRIYRIAAAALAAMKHLRAYVNAFNSDYNEAFIDVLDSAMQSNEGLYFLLYLDIMSMCRSKVASVR